MSLLEDVVYVLRTVLEYFGVPPDMLDPVWTSQLCGQYRSIIRMIGTNLPLKPPPRVHFQIPLVANMLHDVDATGDTPAIPSLADIMWVFEDKGDSFAKTRMHLPPKKQNCINAIQNDLEPNIVHKKERSAGHAADPETLKKISALESELLKLRAQIAMIVTATPGADQTESHNAPLVSLTSPLPLPALTSTPRSAPAPPPPPPPPPPCPSSSTDTLDVMQLIRQNRKNKTVNGQLQPHNKESENKGMPSMMDVLKNLNQVKLRSVQRSPGGTPVGGRRSKGGAAVLSDPAALIAEALKRKFAQHRHNTSSDKENSRELSPFGSPESPKVSVHFRRSQGRRHF
ncbi:mitochondrial fission regulator 2 isoform X1 [Oryzias latipes]|uniref:Mitochondrial fission regulator n=1 Tax=Oryzias latipes TaxID=8090 RepID=H2MPV4_ORYLA|nr:mitochondrial fission regulator 2 isoform X1 [Oryzias latipes]XP_020570080.1 mitochondrial fission regulator 2 isoform X1 [Oryzias latipes]